MHRRRFLTITGSSLTVPLAGCSEGNANESPGDDPETTVEAWQEALENGNAEEARALVHPDSTSMADYTGLDPAIDGLEVSVTDTEAVSNGERVVTADLTLTYDDGEATAVVEHVVRTNGNDQWRIYDVQTVERVEHGDERDPTDPESTAQVSNSVNVLNAVGTVAADGDSIGEVRLSVAPAAGADEIDLTDVTIQYVSEDDFANLVHVERAESGDAAFDTVPITAADESNDVLSDSSDRYEVVVDLAADVAGNGDNSNLGTLAPGEEAEIVLTTAAGAQVEFFVQSPDSLAGEEAGDTVTL